MNNWRSPAQGRKAAEGHSLGAGTCSWAAQVPPWVWREAQGIGAAWVAWGSLESGYTGCLQILRARHPPLVEWHWSLGTPGGGMQVLRLDMQWERQTARCLTETMKSGSALAVLAWTAASGVRSCCPTIHSVWCAWIWTFCCGPHGQRQVLLCPLAYRHVKVQLYKDREKERTIYTKMNCNVKSALYDLTTF